MGKDGHFSVKASVLNKRGGSMSINVDMNVSREENDEKCC